MDNKKATEVYFENGIALLDGKPFTGNGRGRKGFPLSELKEYKDELKSLDLGIQFGKNNKTKKLKISSFLEEEEIEFNYLDGKRHGANRVFYKNGDLKSETNYHKGLMEGLEKRWDENGDLTAESNYVTGKLQGVKKTYKKGKIESETEWKNDEMIGLKGYDEDGFMVMEEEYENGEIVSSKFYWYENGVRHEC